MFYGLTFMRWDERLGPEVLLTYPEDVKLTVPTMMQIISGHEYLNEAGMISIQNKDKNIVSYFAGNENPMYLNLILSLEENPDDYEDILADTTRILASCFTKNSCSDVLDDLFHQIKEYPVLTDEQKLASIHVDQIKSEILKRLRSEGSVLKTELAIWIRERYQSSAFNIDQVISLLTKSNLVKRASVVGAPDEILFLIQDIVILRTPPVELLKNPHKAGLPNKFISDYRQSALKFFEKYRSDEKDTEFLVKILLDTQIYSIIKELRQSIQTREDLKKIKEIKIDNIEKEIQKLLDNHIAVELLGDKGITYIALQTDISVEKIFPEYLINLIRKDFNYKVKQPAILMEHLSLLEEVFNNTKVK